MGGGTKLYMNHDAVWNLDTTTDIIANTAFGLSFPLLGQLEAQLLQGAQFHYGNFAETFLR